MREWFLEIGFVESVPYRCVLEHVDFARWSDVTLQAFIVDDGRPVDIDPDAVSQRATIVEYIMLQLAMPGKQFVKSRRHGAGFHCHRQFRQDIAQMIGKKYLWH